MTPMAIRGDDWTEVELDSGPIEVRAVIKRFGARQKLIRCFVRPLRFYNSALLFRYDGDGSSLYGAACMEGAVWLTGEAEDIHALNAMQALTVTPWTVVEYARFFCRFLRAESGWFTLLEEDGIDPPTYRGRDLDGRFVVDAHMRIEDCVYAVRLAVDEQGGVDMLEDVALAA